MPARKPTDSVLAAFKEAGIKLDGAVSNEQFARCADSMAKAIRERLKAAGKTVAEAHDRCAALEARCSALETRCGILEGSTPDDGPDDGELPGEVASAKPRRKFGKATDEFNAAGKLWRTTRTAPDGSYIAKTFDPATGKLTGTTRGQR